MPIHDFYCAKCSKLFEIIVPLSKTNKAVKCPYCKKKLKKGLSAPKVIRIN